MRHWVLALGLLLGLAVPARAGETPIPPAPAHWVTDTAGLLQPSTTQALDARLERYQQATGHQVVAWIGSTLGGSPLEEWCAKAFSAWGIGRKGKDDGVVIFVFAKDHLIHIEVGYGVEDLLPDAYAARIVHDVMSPALAAGDPDRALTGAVDQVLTRLGGEPNGVAAPALAPPAPKRPSLVVIVLAMIGGVLVLVFVATHPRMAMWLLWNLMSSGIGGGRGGGFGGGGGGGFSGGGGRSGGGGASGSW
jgi:uncharacterized protein